VLFERISHECFSFGEVGRLKEFRLGR